VAAASGSEDRAALRHCVLNDRRQAVEWPSNRSRIVVVVRSLTLMQPRLFSGFSCHRASTGVTPYSAAWPKPSSGTSCVCRVQVLDSSRAPDVTEMLRKLIGFKLDLF